MTPEQLAVVRASYGLLGSDATSMAEDFYERLFAADPSTRALFNDGPEIMAVKFTAELDAIVEAIASFDEFRVRVVALGATHLRRAGQALPRRGRRRVASSQPISATGGTEPRDSVAAPATSLPRR
jgi:hypothetical protein